MRNVQLVQDMPQMRRSARTPKHNFHVKVRPYQIVPFMIAPVLPGETMKNALLQARTVTKPIKNGIIGWWNEFYLFYVKHRDLDIRDSMDDMVLTPGYDMSSFRQTVSDDTDFYTSVGSVKWARYCYDRVVRTYFRDAEDNATYTIGNYASCQIEGNSIWDSAVYDASYDTSTASPTGSVDDLDRLRLNWEFMVQQNATQQTYEDFLRTYGVKMSRQEEHCPELIRYTKDWSYPANTIDPVTGVPSSAVSWATSERADKDRFFKEPGFIFGVHIIRPKMYLGKQRGNASGLLDDVLSFMPRVVQEEAMLSMKKYTAANSNLTGATDLLWYDLRDLYVYGDQFLNFALTDTDKNLLGLPTTALNKRYPTATDADSLFTGTDKYAMTDGVCSLNVLSSIVDTTPRSRSIAL